MTEPCEPVDTLGHRPPPPWYGWTIKLTLAVALLLLGLSQALSLIYLAPMAHQAVTASATEKEQSACYDLFTARVTDGNAAVFATLTATVGAIGQLIVDLAAQPRNQDAVQADIEAIKSAATLNTEALATYDRTNHDRKQYAAAGRPLPCPLDPT